jgi:hypothetical protein
MRKFGQKLSRSWPGAPNRSHRSQSQPLPTDRPTDQTPEICSPQPLDFHRSPDAGLRSPGASAAVYIGKPRILHASNLARRAVSSFGAHAPYWAIPAAPRSGPLTVEVRGPIFGFAVGDRLLAAQALDVEQAPTAMVVDCSFASGSASPLDAGRPTTER